MTDTTTDTPPELAYRMRLLRPDLDTGELTLLWASDPNGDPDTLGAGVRAAVSEHADPDQWLAVHVEQGNEPDWQTRWAGLVRPNAGDPGELELEPTNEFTSAVMFWPESQLLPEITG